MSHLHNAMMVYILLTSGAFSVQRRVGGERLFGFLLDISTNKKTIFDVKFSSHTFLYI